MSVESIKTYSKEYTAAYNQSVNAAQTFVNMNDSQIHELAEIKTAYDKKEKKNNGLFNKLFWAIPAVDIMGKSLLAGRMKYVEQGQNVLKHFPLSAKTYMVGMQALDWGAIIAGVGIFSEIKKYAVHKSEGYRRFNENNPTGSFMFDIAGIIAGGLGLKTLINKFVDNHSNEALEKKLLKLDESKFDKNVVQKYANWAERFESRAPKAANAAKYILRNSTWMLLGLGLGKMILDSGKEATSVNKNYKELKDKQLEVAKLLANENL